MSIEEQRLVDIVRKANEKLLDLGCPNGQLDRCTKEDGFKIYRFIPDAFWDEFNMWANVRNGALMKLVKIRDAEAGYVPYFSNRRMS